MRLGIGQILLGLIKSKVLIITYAFILYFNRTLFILNIEKLIELDKCLKIKMSKIPKQRDKDVQNSTIKYRKINYARNKLIFKKQIQQFLIKICKNIIILRDKYEEIMNIIN